MIRNRRHVGLLALLALGLGLVYLGLATFRSGQANTCHTCRRPIHEESLAIGRDDGIERAYCCLTCILTHHQQSGKTVEVVELRDHETGEPLPPEHAFIVRESDVNLCLRHAVLADREGASTLEFDRCAPSMLAFATRQGAEDFQRRHGGILLTFAQVQRAFETP